MAPGDIPPLRSSAATAGRLRRAQTERDRKAEQERLQQLFQQAPGFICVLHGPRHVYELANDAYYQLVGHRQIIGHPLPEVLPEVVPQGFLDKLDQVYQTGEPFIGRAMPIQLQRLADGDLEQRFIDLIYQPILSGEGKVTGIFVQGNDVTEAHQLAQEVSYRAAHDPLTGLSNRRDFADKTANLQGTGPHALLYMDIDHFKIVNDRCGHAAGDQLLTEVASHIRQQSSSDDVLARLGGDEFALVRWKCSKEEAVALADQMRQAVKAIDFVWQGRRYGVSLSVGVASFGDASSDTTDHALGLADAACFLAKEKGRNRTQISSATDEEVVLQQRDMDNATRLKRALAEDRVELYVQKIMPLSSGSHVDLMYEVLARLRELDGRLVSPGSFIPAAERFGLIDDLDRHILHKAFSSLEAMERDGGRATYFLNLSGGTLGVEDFPDYVAKLLVEHPNVCATQICFEITETAAVSNVRRTAASMRLLGDMGFRFALDDFGSGMASFSYLKQLPVHFVKIDGEFVRAVLEDETNAIIVASVIHVARSMNIETIAEHIESSELAVKLREMGADYGQGFALDRPAPITQPTIT